MCISCGFEKSTLPKGSKINQLIYSFIVCMEKVDFLSQKFKEHLTVEHLIDIKFSSC